MLKLFVTVGTTEFDNLIKHVDLNLGDSKDFLITAQISDHACYKPQYIQSFNFIDNIDNEIERADIVITHAGAGSVYSLLERGKKIIVVPNISRVDHHQLELARYVERCNYGYSCFDFVNLEALINSIQQVEFSKYSKTDFFGIEAILELLK